ncbi:xanthine dehydrogenase small subunit [Corynebacterium variabile]|uniref:xanthine dehydrogenase small subunit n=1 Tax=Corynebacterium variabile TaxID=1727 RepID=UPI003F92433C
MTLRTDVSGTGTTGSTVHTSALDALRDHGLTGCKEGCAEGECGACAIMVARPDGRPGSLTGERTRWVPVNACLIPAAALDGQEIITAEGLGTTTDLHPVQEEMARAGGSQCGYCTPGFISSMAAEYYRPESDQPFDLHSLSGNLCRCTGYRPIRDAALALGTPDSTPDATPDMDAARRATAHLDGEGSAEGTEDAASVDPLAARRNEPAPAPAHTDLTSVTPTGTAARFRRPVCLDEAVRILRDEPGTTVVAGSTDHGVIVNIRGDRPESVLAVDRLPELRGITWADDHVEIGAAQTLTEIERSLGRAVPLLGKLLPQFASRLIRNSATIGGNLGTGSPIGDTPPALLALEASLVLASADGEREVPLKDYFTGYRQSVRRADELISAIRIPTPLQPLTEFHKIAKRRFDDISSVAVGYAVTVTDGVVEKARIGLGGVAATPLRAYATEELLEGSPWTAETVAEAAAVLRAEGTPMSDHRASSAYRSAMLGTSLERFFAESATDTGAQTDAQEVRA